MAQATFALLLEVTNQVGHHNRSVHQGDWQTSKDFSYWQTPLMELAGKTIGLIGYGAIAQAVATIAHAFQLKVIYFNHRPKPAQQIGQNKFRWRNCIKKQISSAFMFRSFLRQKND